MGGKPKHNPTDVSRAEVSALVSFGITQEDIGKYLNIDRGTLMDYYRRELDTAVTMANAKVAQRLYNKAVQQDDLQAQIFWLKTRAKWRTADKEKEVESNVETLEKIKSLVADLNKTNSSEI